MSTTILPPPSLPTSSQPPATTFPQLGNLNLPRPLTQAITQSFQVAYAVRDQATATSNALVRKLQYGTWNDRINTDPTSLPIGALWFHTDFLNAVYQIRMDPKSNQLQWFYGTGVIWIPTGIDVTTLPKLLALALNDIGFMVASSGHLYVWDGKGPNLTTII
jgi:hypothetical protein